MAKAGQNTGRSNDGGGRITGKHVFLMFASFFGVIFAVNFLLAYQAEKSWSGLVVPNSYVASQQFNKRLEAARQQKALGWYSSIGYKDGAVFLKLTDSNGKPVILDEAHVKVGHPINEREDKSLMLEYAGNGLYLGRVLLQKGSWQLEINGRKNDQPFHLEDRFIIAKPQAG